MNNKKLIILGAGGHGRVAAEIAEQLGYSVSFLDDTKSYNKRIPIPLFIHTITTKLLIK